MEEEKYKGSIPEATVVKDGKNQKKISCFTRTVVHYPCVVMLISGVISIILVAIVGSGDSFRLGSSWMNYEDKITKQCFATFRLGSLVGEKQMEDLGIEPYGTRLCKADTQSESIWGGDLRIYLRSKSGNVLSQENLDVMKMIISEWEAKTTHWPEYCRLKNLTHSDTECEEPLSFFRVAEIENLATKSKSELVPLTSMACNVCKLGYNSSFKCPNLALVKDMDTPSDLKKTPLTREQMEPYMKNLCEVGKSKENTLCEMSVGNLRKTLVGIDWDCNTLKAEYAQIVFRTGWPFKNAKKDNPEFCNHDSESNKTFPDKMWGSFYFSSKENEGLRNMLALIEKVKKDHPDLDMGFRSPGDFGFIWTVLINDVMLVVISVVLVAITLAVQTGSLFLMFTGMFEILVSFPMACFVWLIIFQEKGVTNLMFIGVFVILGIGADDIFVFVDAWKQSELQDESISGSLETRFEWAYRRAVVAMTSTSVTTFFCFCICIISPVWDFRCFGVACGFMILADFALVITWFPASVIILETRINPLWKKMCGNLCKKKNDNANATAIVQPKKARRMEIFFGGPFADFVFKNNKILIVVWAIIAITSISVTAGLLRLSNKEFKFAPDDHQFSKNEKFAEKFRAEDTFEPAALSLYYGLKGESAWDLGDAYPADIVGTPNSGAFGNGDVQYDEDYNFALNQQKIVDTCDTFHEKMKKDDLDANSYDATYNVMNDFATWCRWKGHGFPTPEENFATLFNDFSTAPDGYRNYSTMRYRDIGERPSTYARRTGFLMNEKKDKMLSLWCGFNLTSLGSGWGEPYRKVDTVQKRMDVYLAETKEKTKETSSFQMCDKYLFNRMIFSVFQFSVTSVAISYVIAVMVILVMTGNWKVALISAAVLLSIISFALMGLVIMGFEMGLNECCAILVAAGMAVDYLLHMSHSFNHQHGTKEERTRKALAEMGISVFSGCITTASASIALCATVFFIFSRMGIFLIWLIPFGFISSVTFLTALFSYVGPNDGEGMIPWLGEFIHKTAKTRTVSPRNSEEGDVVVDGDVELTNKNKDAASI